MSSRTYIKNEIKVVEALLCNDDPGPKLKSMAKNPFPTGYRPELDMTAELSDEHASRYSQLLVFCVGLSNLDALISFLRYHSCCSTKHSQDRAI
jgi:hypothetical protein